MEGFIDPTKFLIFFAIVLVISISLLSGIVGLIVAFVKAKKTKQPITKQKSFVFAMSAFIIGFFDFVALHVMVK